MSALMQNLKFHIERAKKNYISSFSFFKTLSKRRAADLRRLGNIVSNPSNILSVIYEIKSALKQMKTGWGIFDFGHSRLKNLVKEEIKKFKKIHNVNANAYVALTQKVQPNSIQQIVRIPVVQKTKTEKFSISACKKHLQFKPQSMVQPSKPMIKLDDEKIYKILIF